MPASPKSDQETFLPAGTRLLLLGLLALLAGFSAYLSLNRIYQVDEAQNVFMARIIGTGQTGSYYTNAPLWLLGPLAWLARSATKSAELFLWNRAIFLGVFWINILLLALCTGVRLRSGKGLCVLLMAATLTPLWDYGLEIRHDNLILTLILGMWWMGRVRPRGLASYAGIGFLAMLMQFLAFKAFAFAAPLSLAFLVFPAPGHGRSRLRLALAWAAGAVAAFLLCRLAYGVSGLWPVFKAGQGMGMDVSGAASTRFYPWISLIRPVTQTPLLLALATAALASALSSLYRKDGALPGWSGLLPECLLFLGTLGVLLVNPTPFPYNLVNVIPFAFLLAFRFLDPLLPQLGTPGLSCLAGGVLVFAHLVPFGTATWRHLEWSNDRQELLMQTAEALTDPARDPVYDAIGMVPTRPSINFHWYLHSLNIKSFLDGKEPSVAQMLEARPAAVVIPSYRTDWLSMNDSTYIHDHYLPLADDFWVLGQVLPAGGGRFPLAHGGRYQLLANHSGNILPLASASVDGHPMTGSLVAFAPGTHEITCPPLDQPIYIWVGPKLDRLPSLPPGDHHRLFANWY